MANIIESLPASFQDLGSNSSKPSLQEDFVWEWYIRVKIQFPTPAISELIERISSEVQNLWERLNLIIIEPKNIQLWPSILTNTAQSNHFWFIGIFTLPSSELAQCKKSLKEWLKTTKEKINGRISIIEAKFITRKVFVAMEKLVVFEPTETDAEDFGTESARVEKGKVKEVEFELIKTKKVFKKTKGSNPQEVRRQFLYHQIGNSGSPSSGNSHCSTKLRPGREILNQLKFDSAYIIGDYVVGYIDRKDGILEMSIDKWDELEFVNRKGREELMAYIKNVESKEIVWDKAMKIDVLAREKGS